VTSRPSRWWRSECRRGEFHLASVWAWVALQEEEEAEEEASAPAAVAAVAVAGRS